MMEHSRENPRPHPAKKRTEAARAAARAVAAEEAAILRRAFDARAPETYYAF
jgi:hypothetical protein